MIIETLRFECDAPGCDNVVTRSHGPTPFLPRVDPDLGTLCAENGWRYIDGKLICWRHEIAVSEPRLAKGKSLDFGEPVLGDGSIVGEVVP